MTEATPFEIEVYETQDGRSPFIEWLRNLRDRSAAARVRARLARVRLGNFGDSEPVGGGLHELRIEHGPGYRVYYGRVGKRLVLMLCAGSKKAQQRDINQARQYWDDYRSRVS